VLAASSRQATENGGWGRRIIGLSIHRAFAEAGWNARGPKARTAPQRRSDNKAARQGSPHALLFATRSSVRDSRLARSEARR
jgi:hypothetical protein